MNSKIGNDIDYAAEILKRGNLVAIPTETVYGLAANALDEKAVSKIFEAKNRPKFDPLIIHVSNIKKINQYVKTIPNDLLSLIQKFSPGPLTILLEKKELIPDLVTSGLEKVAIRIPNHKLTLELLSKIDFPLAAPSANPFGYVSPTTAQHVFDQLGSKIDYILDGGNCEVGLESTIVGIENNKLIVYRKGGLEIEKIAESCALEIVVNDRSDSNPKAPGMLIRHYSPNAEIKILDAENPDFKHDNSGFLRFCKYLKAVPKSNQFVLSENENLTEAAQNLFKALRWLDDKKFETIYIQLVPEYGLGIAINDRLRRAAAI